MNLFAAVILFSLYIYIFKSQTLSESPNGDLGAFSSVIRLGIFLTFARNDLDCQLKK